MTESTRATFTMVLTADEAKELVGALFVASDANADNDNTAPDGRSWRDHSRALAVRAREAGIAAGLVSAEEEFSLVAPIVPAPTPPDDGIRDLFAIAARIRP